MDRSTAPALGKPSPIPKSVFSTEAIPAKERFDVWTESVSPLFRPHLADHVRPENFTGRTDAFMLDNTILASSSLAGLAGYQSIGNSPLNDRPEVFVVQLYLRGGFRGHNGAQSLDVTPGDVVILDSTRPMTTRVDDSELLSFVVPRQAMLSALGPQGDVVPHVISGKTASGRILANAFRSAWDSLPESASADTKFIKGLLLGAVTGLLRYPDEDPPPSPHGKTAVDQATLDAIRAHIERNLMDPNLGPEQLCRHFGCSRATLYRLFAPLDGIANFIRRARLERTHAELLGNSAHRTVTQIALRWGFGNFSNFCRLFRNTFGVTPGEVLDRGRAARSRRSDSDFPTANSRLPVPEYRYWIEGM